MFLVSYIDSGKYQSLNKSTLEQFIKYNSIIKYSWLQALIFSELI